MLNCHFNVSIENFRDKDKPIDRAAIEAAILKVLKDGGHSADAVQLGTWNEQRLPPESKLAV